jgi:hypothetical protein
MNGLWDNPVTRHALRGGKIGWYWGALALLFAACALGALLQSFWMELPIYSFLRPQLAVRWMGLTVVAETVIAVPWAAVRGAVLWRRLCRDGHLNEYRRTRMPAYGIAFGTLVAALRPVALLLAGSLLLGVAAHFRTPELTLAGVFQAHLLLAMQAVCFGTLGIWWSTWVRYPAMAIPLALSGLTAAIGGLWCLEPFYRVMHDPSPWIYAALLPNPVTAIGNVLNTDVLRFSWIYEHVHAHEYDFIYPPAWQTGGIYLVAALLLAAGVTWRIANLES